MTEKTYDALIVGGGAAGLAGAIGLAQAGLKTVIIGVPDAPRDDGRSAALFQSSLTFLDTLGVGEALRERGARLCAIRLIDITGALIRAPTVTFKASEIGQEAFGWNIANSEIIEVMAAIARNTAGLEVRSALLSSFEDLSGHVLATLDTHETIRTQLVIGADGQNSRVREGAGIAHRVKDYPQSALTCRLSHPRDHEDISLEFHTREGPFTFVPSGDHRSALVWIMQPDKAKAMHALTPTAFAQEITRRSSSILGKVQVDGNIGLVPMRKLLADRLVAGRIALVGEAAHAFPPIGAQGLNLGLKDVEALILSVSEAFRAGEDPGLACLSRYEKDRQVDVKTRSAGVDILNSALIADRFPSDFMRAIGLGLMRDIGPLRRMVMRAGGWSPLFSARS